MLKRIENSEVMTVSEFKKKYADNWFIYFIVDDRPDAEYLPSDGLEAKVTWIGNTEEELIPVLRAEISGYHAVATGILWGDNVNPEPWLSLGGLEIE